MADTSTVPAFLDAFKAALEARVGLADVDVFTGHPGDSLTRLKEAIVFLSVEFDQNYATATGRRKAEDYTVNGSIWVVRPGAGEPVIKTARDRAYAIQDEIEEELRSNKKMTNTVHLVQFSSGGHQAGGGDGNRWHENTFTVAVEAHLYPD